MKHIFTYMYKVRGWMLCVEVDASLIHLLNILKHIKFRDLLSLEKTENQMCLHFITHNQTFIFKIRTMLVGKYIL